MMDVIVPKPLRENEALAEKAAQWFSNIWGIPYEAYYDSIQDCIKNPDKIPQWYVCLDQNGELVAGAGIIENDFHDRKDLSPNLCALYVAENYRSQGIAKSLLDYARKDLGKLGFHKLYLVTDHTEFYEKCGWEFLTMVHDEDGTPERLYMAAAL